MASEGKFEDGSKPSVLILGGMGMVGRNLVSYLVENRLASAIRVADKKMSMLAYLSARHEYNFANTVVEEMQMDLSRDTSVGRAFDREGGKKWDYVFCFAAETTFGKAEDVYAQRTVDLARKCGAMAAETGVTKFIYMSSGSVYASQTRKPADESAKIKPWTTPAKFNLMAEDVLRDIPSLNLVVVRPALVYGSGDCAGLMPVAVMAAVYAATNDKLALLWDKHFCRNTVHVDDVCSALWLIAQKAPAGELYNLADPNNTTQGDIVNIFAELFGIKIGYHGKLVSNLARVRMDSVVETANDNHLRPWMDMLAAAKIPASPLSPVMHREMLNHNHLYVDGNKITTTLGFTYKHTKPTLENVSEMVYEYVKLNLLPVSDLVLPAMKARRDAEAATEGTADAGDSKTEDNAGTSSGAGAGAGAGAGGAGAGSR